ncbi:DUF3027 domain-containing protein [Corynebacterium lipophiloflavum]|uniref:DUF3027 domain-containing protein n=1 Tax=Corynebacterium lipophiloflavum (strain ATCC 700352 / DSM 44291 / CCUG 37336 / JCM 10383 / DMMZ 1944) TaxID=525263 RepID=C0XQC1_CORLD|nr:DUF3027 domain-containing protein [Corynebacterium lipophiloflavum]EEI17609.1 hypothetical protein HMPREF0298_0641 [Corynebacterium lipophiloflavum DSM 44291]
MSQSRNRAHRRANSPLLGEAAVAAARQALEEIAEGGIGSHIGVAAVSPNVATHRFEADVPGYPGWEWNADVACATGASRVTINEVALVPASDALQAPEWVPYSDRLRPGDLGPGDVMEAAPDDHRLTDDSFDKNAVTFVGRETANYLTVKGLEEAKQRWRTGDFGPTSEFAEQAAMACRTCAFYIPMAPPVGENFGVCANEYAADGRLVASSYGCGAHSQTKVAAPELLDSADVYDDERPVF